MKLLKDISEQKETVYFITSLQDWSDDSGEKTLDTSNFH